MVKRKGCLASMSSNMIWYIYLSSPATVCHKWRTHKKVFVIFFFIVVIVSLYCHAMLSASDVSILGWFWEINDMKLKTTLHVIHCVVCMYISTTLESINTDNFHSQAKGNVLSITVSIIYCHNFNHSFANYNLGIGNMCLQEGRDCKK